MTYHSRYTSRMLCEECNNYMFYFVTLLCGRHLVISYMKFFIFYRYNQGKKFYCKYKGDKYDCLGRGKGRSYGRMTSKEWQFLSDYYHLPNMKLYDLLISLNKKIPKWLKKEIDKIEKDKS